MISFNDTTPVTCRFSSTTYIRWSPVAASCPENIKNINGIQKDGDLLYPPITFRTGESMRVVTTAGLSRAESRARDLHLPIVMTATQTRTVRAVTSGQTQVQLWVWNWTLALQQLRVDLSSWLMYRWYHCDLLGGSKFWIENAKCNNIICTYATQFVLIHKRKGFHDRFITVAKHHLLSDSKPLTWKMCWLMILRCMLKFSLTNIL